ncbi:MAG: hypothetical protein GY849_17495 [Deltaproteobacteria bacterium]|nr:hypothetical protein [Deltaproteobacteria bacterium]
MEGQQLKSEFTKEFFEEYQYDTEFRSIFFSIQKGMSPFLAIEHLCKSKKELFNSLKIALENTPTKIVVTNERFEHLKNEIE